MDKIGTYWKAIALLISILLVRYYIIGDKNMNDRDIISASCLVFVYCLFYILDKIYKEIKNGKY